METSRIFVRNLPPNIKTQDLRKHFSMGIFPVTDSRAIPERRIGYIGYASAEYAKRAVKYFHKSFVNSSRISVELARPVGEALYDSSTSS